MRTILEPQMEKETKKQGNRKRRMTEIKMTKREELTRSCEEITGNQEHDRGVL